MAPCWDNIPGTPAAPMVSVYRDLCGDAPHPDPPESLAGVTCLPAGSSQERKSSMNHYGLKLPGTIYLSSHRYAYCNSSSNLSESEWSKLIVVAIFHCQSKTSVTQSHIQEFHYNSSTKNWHMCEESEISQHNKTVEKCRLIALQTPIHQPEKHDPRVSTPPPAGTCSNSVSLDRRWMETIRTQNIHSWNLSKQVGGICNECDSHHVSTS